MSEMRKKTRLLVWPPGLPSKENTDPGKWVGGEKLYMEEHALACQEKRLSFPLYEHANCSQRAKI